MDPRFHNGYPLCREGGVARPREFDESQAVDQAMEAFWTHGYRSTTPKMLVEATGMSKSSLYATFDSKKGLFLAALDRYIAQQVVFMGQLLDQGTLKQSMAQMYAKLVFVGPVGDARYCLVCSASLEVPGDDAETLQRVARGHQELRHLFTARFQRAIDEGELRAGTDPNALASYVVNGNMGLQVTARVQPDPKVLRQIADQLLDSLPFA